jgi:hypothetical protein
LIEEKTRRMQALVMTALGDSMSDHPAIFTPNLARSLYNLTIRLSELGRREDALEVIKEAVNLCRRLAADSPVAFNLDLAFSLHVLANCSSDLSHREVALQAIKEV